MRGEQAAIEAMGGRLLFVGNGTTEQAREFHDRYAPGGAIFTDPSAYTYRAIGAHAGMASTVGGIVLHGPRALRQGHIQTSIKGRPFQHGGVVIAVPGNVAAYAYISKVAGDHPSNADVVAALAEATRDARDRARAASELAQGAATPATDRPPRDGEGQAADGAIRGLPGWPGAPPGAPVRQPRWTFELPGSGPPRSAAG